MTEPGAGTGSGIGSFTGTGTSAKFSSSWVLVLDQSKQLCRHKCYFMK